MRWRHHALAAAICVYGGCGGGEDAGEPAATPSSTALAEAVAHGETAKKIPLDR